jgi:hypothetical protein
LKHVHMQERTNILVMDLEEIEARNDCAGEGQQQFNRPNECVGGIGVQTQCLLKDRGNPRKTLIELAGHRTSECKCVSYIIKLK